MTISQLSPAPAERLGQRLTPGRYETLTLCLLSGAILFAAWSGRTWILACLAALCLLWLITAVVSGIAGRGYRPRRGAIALVIIGWVSAQAYLRARARVAGSPEGALTTTSTSISSASFSDPLDLAIADLLSRTQMMRVDALAVDLTMSAGELKARLEDLLARGFVNRERRDDGPVDDHHWVHLTFHGEQQLAAALQSTSANTP